MRKNIDLNLEALRGFCALMVLVHHCIVYSNTLTPGYNFRKSFLPYTPSGHLMVMIFFMLSGYVIGYTSLNRKFELSEYIKKRLVRLYPIYLIAILGTMLLFSESLKSIMATTFFLQNIFADVIINNNPLWSLNHEVVTIF